MERRGFTIIETMVSIVIVTFVIVAAITGVLSVATAEKRSEKTIEAKDIANYVLDYIRSRNVTFDNPMGFDSSLFGNDENNRCRVLLMPMAIHSLLTRLQRHQTKSSVINQRLFIFLYKELFH